MHDNEFPYPSDMRITLLLGEFSSELDDTQQLTGKRSRFGVLL